MQVKHHIRIIARLTSINGDHGVAPKSKKGPEPAAQK